MSDQTGLPRRRLRVCYKQLPRARFPTGQSADRGWVAERFKAPVLKTGEGASSPWVRIPPHPPAPKRRRSMLVVRVDGPPLWQSCEPSAKERIAVWNRTDNREL